jgi:hypothetical protein
MPLHARAIPDHPVKERACPFNTMLRITENILRVVVTVDRTSGSKFEMV